MKIKLKTLSPVHIGSGTQYQGNAEYLYFEREKVVVLADETRILDIIGPENIHIWVNYIEMRERGSFLDYLRQRKPDIRPEDIALRVIPLKGARSPIISQTLREQIRSGIEGAYLPGSSIKGAMRTAIFADTMLGKYQAEGVPEAKLGTTHRFNNKFSINDKPLQQEIFGKDPNSDWLRMLQVGDCYVKTGTHAAFAETLNERGEMRYEIKGEVRQLIEYIPAGAAASFDLNIPEKHLALIGRKMPELFRPAAKDFSLKSLCSLLKKHSLRLLDNEIAFFEDADLPAEAEGLPDFLAELRRDAADFPDNTCLLRLGFGTGYRNMTGDWVKDLVPDDDLYDDIATAVRRTTRYNGLPLPKSRKMMFDGILPGYVQLTFES